MTEIIDNVARAIYMAHWDPSEENRRGPDHRFPPVWDAASEPVKEWCRVQARAAIEAMGKTRLPKTGTKWAATRAEILNDIHVEIDRAMGKYASPEARAALVEIEDIVIWWFNTPAVWCESQPSSERNYREEMRCPHSFWTEDCRECLRGGSCAYAFVEEERRNNGL